MDTLTERSPVGASLAAALTTIFLLFTVRASAELPSDIMVYYPADVGHEWVWEVTDLRGDRAQSRTSTLRVGRKELDEGSGVTTFSEEKNRRLFQQTAAGLVDPDGTVFFKTPLSAGSEWITKGEGGAVRTFRILKAGTSATVRNKTYADCIVVEADMNPAAVLDERGTKVVYKHWGQTMTYCRDIGLVYGSGYEIADGGRVVEMTRELVSFKTGQSVATLPAPPSIPMIEREKAFRYSYTFLHHRYNNPLLSPDEKWLVYRRSDEGRSFEHLYTRLGRQDANRLPLAGTGKITPDPNFIRANSWSPDGIFLALTAGGDSYSVIIVAFDDDGARHIETIPADDNPSVQWDDGGAFYFVDDKGSLVKKQPGTVTEVLDRAPARPDRRVSYHLSGSSLVVTVRSPRYGPVSKIRKEVRSIRPPSLKPLFTASSDSDHCLELLPSEDGEFLYLREDWNSAQVLELKSGREVARVGRCEKAEWSPSAPLLACTEYRVGQEPGPNGKERVTATSGFLVVDARRGEVKDCGFAIDKTAYRWTPDGRHVIFSGRFEDAQHRSMQPGIFIMRISDCNLLPRISRHGAESPSSPQISPSGRHLVWQNYGLGTFFAVPNPLTPDLFRANSGTRRP